MLSPGSRKPAKAENMPCGHAAWRPSRQRSPRTASMITTGSVRGKCSTLQEGQKRFQPPSFGWLGWPQLAQWRWRRRHSNIALGGGEHGGVGGRQVQRDRAQVLEPAEPLQRPVGRVGRSLHVEGEDGGLLPQAHEQQPLAVAESSPARSART